MAKVMKETHQNYTKTFEELNFSEQSKSISAQILSIGKAIKAHERRARTKEEIDKGRDANKVLLNCISQLSRLIDRLTK
ncbi:MAG: hypothetical protein V1779_08870 [bacterium]